MYSVWPIIILYSNLFYLPLSPLHGYGPGSLTHVFLVEQSFATLKCCEYKQVCAAVRLINGLNREKHELMGVTRLGELEKYVVAFQFVAIHLSFKPCYQGICREKHFMAFTHLRSKWSRLDVVVIHIRFSRTPRPSCDVRVEFLDLFGRVRILSVLLLPPTHQLSRLCFQFIRQAHSWFSSWPNENAVTKTGGPCNVAPLH